MADWADEKAREWLPSRIISTPNTETFRREAKSLAALLREVYGRAKSETLVRCCICEDATAPRPDCDCVICHRNRTLAEVRRVVEETRRSYAHRVPLDKLLTAEQAVCDEILSRLDKL